MTDVNTTVLPPPVIATTLGAMQGPSGPPGQGSDTLEFTQAVASDTWVINHNFGWKPNVQILSVGGRELLAEVLHVSVNQVQVFFDTPQAGLALLS